MKHSCSVSSSGSAPCGGCSSADTVDPFFVVTNHYRPKITNLFFSSFELDLLCVKDCGHGFLFIDCLVMCFVWIIPRHLVVTFVLLGMLFVFMFVILLILYLGGLLPYILNAWY